MKEEYKKKYVLGQHSTVPNGYYAIDPDQAGGVDPFNVYCRGWETVLRPSCEFDIVMVFSSNISGAIIIQ